MRLGFADLLGREANEDGIAGIEEGFRAAEVGREVNVLEVADKPVAQTLLKEAVFDHVAVARAELADTAFVDVVEQRAVAAVGGDGRGAGTDEPGADIEDVDGRE